MGLLELAKRKFLILSDAERKMLQAVAAGEEAVLSEPDGPPPDGADLPVLRGEVLAWLLTDKKAIARVPRQGVTIWGARIDRKLDASFARFPWQFGLFRCLVEADMYLQDAEIGLLNFGGSRVQGLNADRIRVKGGVFLDDGFEAKGQVRLMGAEIGGNLECNGGTFLYIGSEDVVSLAADRIRVKGDVFLSNGFNAKGQVRFLGAIIEGNLACRGGKFLHESSDGDAALTADGIRVKGNVFLDDGFESMGQVRLVGAEIGVDLACRGGKFHHEGAGDDAALAADAIRVRGSLYLSSGFEAQGQVRITGADIGGNLSFTKGRFLRQSRSAVVAETAHIANNVFIRNAEFQGGVILLKARIGSALVMDKGNRWDDVATLNLKHASAASVSVAESALPSWERLRFDGFIYESIRNLTSDMAEAWIGRLDLMPSDCYCPQPYEQLAKVLKAAGFDEEAKQVQIAKNDTLRSFHNGSHHKLVHRRLIQRFLKAPRPDLPRLYDLMQSTIPATGSPSSDRAWYSRMWFALTGWVLGYGYRPWWTVGWMIGVILFGMGVFGLARSHDTMTPLQAYVSTARPVNATGLPGTLAWDEGHRGDASIRHHLADDYPPFHPLWYSLDVFLPLVDLKQENFWLPDRSKSDRREKFLGWSAGEWTYAYMVLHILLGWFLTSLLVAGWTGVIRQ